MAGSMAQVEQLEAAIQEQRTRLAPARPSSCAKSCWPAGAVGKAGWWAKSRSRWGFSPFSCVLRLYQGIGGPGRGRGLVRVRSAAQLALWGRSKGGRRWRARRHKRRGQSATTSRARPSAGKNPTCAPAPSSSTATRPKPDSIAASWNRPIRSARQDAVAGSFIGDASAQLQTVIHRQADAIAVVLLAVLRAFVLGDGRGACLYRFGKNFFYDSWLGPEWGFTATAQPVLGTDFFLGAALVLVAWSALLLWSFTSRLRRD